eukprot:sb/3465932/
MERESLVIWRSPVQTLYYCTMQLGCELIRAIKFVLSNIARFLVLLVLCGLAAASFQIEGPHTPYTDILSSKFSWCLYWVGLGVLSSVGLGTGLHTFLLYLGPHIASVTMAAWECGSLDFPEPPYPEQITCGAGPATTIDLWTIVTKVRLEAFMWGAGTALGELPPYFMARAARLSGQKVEDEDFNELDELKGKNDLDIWSRAKLAMHTLVQRAGFIGILLCASIPNPLFDLAGLTCGHFLVPFTTFFGATLIGKAVVKMHIQMLFVVFIFSKHHLEALETLISSIPEVGPAIHTPFVEFMDKQKAKLRSGGKQGGGGGSESVLSKCFEVFVVGMILYFVVSLINSLAQQYYKDNVEGQKAKKAK